MLKKYLDETLEKNDLLMKQTVQKEMEISHMKIKLICANKKEKKCFLNQKLKKNSTTTQKI